MTAVTSPSSVARTTPPAAILWDLDGTLVDTEPLWIAAETALVHSHGGVWTHEDALTLVGNSLDESAEILISRGVNLTPEQLIATLIEQVNGEVERLGPQWRPGARELVSEAAERGIPQAIVTMSYRVQAETVAAALPPGAITTIVAGDMVSAGKPDPEAYLMAAEVLGVSITECIAVEDSVTGVRAALASGAKTLTVPHIQDVPAFDGLARATTLAGLDVDGLVAVVSTAWRAARPDGSA